jgi:hypothetical protein
MDQQSSKKRKRTEDLDLEEYVICEQHGIKTLEAQFRPCYLKKNYAVRHKNCDTSLEYQKLPFLRNKATGELFTPDKDSIKDHKTYILPDGGETHYVKQEFVELLRQLLPPQVPPNQQVPPSTPSPEQARSTPRQPPESSTPKYSTEVQETVESPSPPPSGYTPESPNDYKFSEHPPVYTDPDQHLESSTIKYSPEAQDQVKSPSSVYTEATGTPESTRSYSPETQSVYPDDQYSESPKNSVLSDPDQLFYFQYVLSYDESDYVFSDQENPHDRWFGS